ncbi:MAG TPA: L-fucose:H+ symporter permease [Terriglobales bacterium]|nr:L-fucose:H+ symporter permease [Terriglobales bacterium]
MRQSVPLTEQKYLAPLVLVTSLFFLWALGVNLNDILIPHLKKAFSLTDTQSSLIQAAFFGGYFLAALPAGRIMERIGYKRGIILGLLICATGTVLFIPAATVRVYGFFLFALFIMACGQSFLEVGANPYVTTLGPAASSERRLNLAQSFNSVGAVLTPVIGAAFILTNAQYSPEQLGAMTPSQLEAYRAAEASTVKGPYLAITCIFLLVALMIYLARLPEIHEVSDGEDRAQAPRWSAVLAHPHLIKGVVAQFFYVGAQVGVASFIIRFAQHTSPGLSEKVAADYLKLHLLGFMIGRFAGSAIMKVIPAPRLLSIFAGGSLVAIVVAISTSGAVPVWAVVLVGFFHSIMFPTIFALSVKGLGPHTKRGSSLLVMSIIGGAIIPVVMGYISDTSNIQKAFIVPFFCYLYVLYFALRGYRPMAAEADRTVPVGVQAQ